MNASNAYAALLKLGVPVVGPAEAAVALDESVARATNTLAALASSGLLKPIRQDQWWLAGPIDPYALPEYLTAPLASYVSLHTALYLHGLSERPARNIYAVSLAPGRRIATRAGTFSIHRVAPEVFGGYETGAGGIKVATPEKALFDFAYLATGRARTFDVLPEIELPRGFRRAQLGDWLAKIPKQGLRAAVAAKLEAFLSAGTRRPWPPAKSV